MPYYLMGILSIEIGKNIIKCGAEKLIINNAIFNDISIVISFRDTFGRSEYSSLFRY